MRQKKTLIQKVRKIGKNSLAQLWSIHLVHTSSHPSESSPTNRNLTNKVVVEYKSLDSNSLRNLFVLFKF